MHKFYDQKKNWNSRILVKRGIDESRKSDTKPDALVRHYDLRFQLLTRDLPR